MTPVAIKETVSQKRRGRPPIFGDDAPELLAGYTSGMFHGLTSHRAVVDGCYRLVAHGALDGHRGFSWFINKTLINSGSKRGYRSTVLAELGRLRHPETIRTVARYLLRERYRGTVRTSRDAAAMVRRFRLIVQKTSA